VDNDSVFCSTCGERIADDAKSTGESSVSQQSPTPNFIDNNSSKKTNVIVSFIKKLNPWSIVGFLVGILLPIITIAVVNSNDYDYIKGWGWLFLSSISIVINSIAVHKSKRSKANNWVSIIGLTLSILFCISIMIINT
jgi:hypothetical protein